MVSVIKRMRKLRQKLLWIRNGPGSIVLPKEVTRISLEFHKKLIGGQHRGARHFWHQMLPSIKYRNPAIPVSVKRHDDIAGPAFLHVYTSTTPAQPDSNSPTPGAQTTLAPDTSTPTWTIDIKTSHESDILQTLIEKTGAKVLETPPEEAEEMEEMEVFKEKSERDRVEVREKLMKERREQELLRLARGESSAAT